MARRRIPNLRNAFSDNAMKQVLQEKNTAELERPDLFVAKEVREGRQDNKIRLTSRAYTHRTTLNACLDFFAQAGSLRAGGMNKFYKRGVTADTSDLAEATLRLFKPAYKEEPTIALRLLAWIGDIRGGAGERAIRRSIMSWLFQFKPDEMIKNFEEYKELFRYDDFIIAANNTKSEAIIFKALIQQLKAEDALVRQSTFTDKTLNISLLAKWMPSENASSPTTKSLAKKFIAYGKLTPREYRKMLSRLRKHLDVLEVKMSANKWDEIDFSKVPSVAMHKFNKAFGRHQYERFTQYIQSVEKGEAKINAGTLQPHQLVAQYSKSYNTRFDPVVEEQWKALPNMMSEASNNSLCIVDVSGSMTWGNANPKPIDVAVSLGIYTAERATGPFKDMFITFSTRPQLVKINPKSSLLDKVRFVMQANWDGSTNVEAAFKLILDIAKQNNLSQDEIPKLLTIISDMQFNGNVARGLDGTTLERMRTMYRNNGYELPNVIFWNVNAYGTFEAKFNENGVGLISGFSQNIIKSMLSGNLTPMNMMLEALKPYERIVSNG